MYIRLSSKEIFSLFFKLENNYYKVCIKKPLKYHISSEKEVVITICKIFNILSAYF